MPNTQFTVNRSQSETRTSGRYLGSIRKTENGKRKTTASYAHFP